MSKKINLRSRLRSLSDDDFSKICWRLFGRQNLFAIGQKMMILFFVGRDRMNFTGHNLGSYQLLSGKRRKKRKPGLNLLELTRGEIRTEFLRRYAHEGLVIQAISQTIRLGQQLTVYEVKLTSSDKNELRSFGSIDEVNCFLDGLRAGLVFGVDRFVPRMEIGITA